MPAATSGLAGIAYDDVIAIVEKEVQQRVTLEMQRLEQRVAELERLVNVVSADSRNLADGGAASERLVKSISTSRDGYAPLALEAANTEAGDPEAAAELPASLFNYCIETITFSSRPWSEPCWFYLICQMVVQQWMAGVLAAMQYWTTIKLSLDSEESFSECMLNRLGAGKIGRGLSMHTITAMICVGIVAVLIHADACVNLSACYPGRDASLALRCVTTVCWWLQGVFLPMCMGTEIAYLLALSTSAMDVLLNALAATFIVEIDELLFEALLSDSKKASYQALSRRDRAPPPDNPEPYMGWFRFATMTYFYFLIDYVRTLPFEESTLFNEKAGTPGLMFAFAIASCSQAWLLQRSHQLSFLGACSFATAAIVGALGSVTWMMFIMVTSQGTTQSIFMRPGEDDELGKDVFQRCMH